MNKKLLELLIGIGLFIIIISFNPLISPFIYTDSTSSFGFISLHKVTLLSILNLVLLGAWLVHIFRSKELLVTSSKIYIPIILFVASFIISTIFSVNRTNSLFGFNSLLGNSLLEMLMLFVFFFIVVNNIRGSESLLRIIRYVVAAIAVSVLWMVFRYTADVNFSSYYINSYLNAPYFVPTGDYLAFVVILLITTIIGFANIYNDVISGKSRNILAFDAILTVIVGAGFLNFINFNEGFKFYMLAALGLLSLAFINYLVFNAKNLKQISKIFTFVSLALVVVGLLSYFTLTKKQILARPYPPVSVSVENTWEVTTKSLDQLQRGFIGNGSGNFAYAFDLYKSPELVPLNLSANFNYPHSREVRINHPMSYYMDVLFSEGALGILAFVSIIFMVIRSGYKKYSEEFDLIGIMFLIAYLVLAFALLFTGYDFTLILLFWLLVAINIILVNNNEPQKSLNLSLSGMVSTMDKRSNYSFIIPLIFIGVNIFVLVISYKLVHANASMFWAKRYQTIEDRGNYTKYTQDALAKFSKSDVFGREWFNTQGIILIQDSLKPLKEQLNDKPELKDNAEFQTTVLKASNYKDQILSSFNYFINLYPQEYRNYYSLGVFLNQVSIYSDLTFDTQAATYFETARSRNTHHPESNFFLAQIFERNKEYNSALGYIQEAVTYDPENLPYRVKFADILVGMENYDDALKYFYDLRSLYAQNPNNPYIAEVYKFYDIDKRIKDTEDLKNSSTSDSETNSESENVQSTPTATPVVSPTPEATVSPIPTSVN